MTRPYLLCLAGALVLVTPSVGVLHAQTPSERESPEAYIEQAAASVPVSLTPLTREEVMTEVFRYLGEEDQAFITLGLARTGGNVVLVQQTGSENTVEAEQNGTGNLAVLIQNGVGNAATLEQTGRDNVFGAWISGDSNEIDVTQDGDNNVYLLDFQGDSLDHTVVQEGDRLQLVQTGRASVPFSVEQHGDDASIIISHNEGE